ncbi:MAG: hypothetical protein NZN45_09605 [Rhodovarius sp.]|nr:hypothetical protein [Rhodovarius sp.]
MIGLLLPPALAAGALAGLGALVGRLGRHWRLGAGLAALALPVGFAWLIGSIQASPRQLPERLPMLALLLLLPAFAAARWPRGLPAGLAAVAGALAGGWWMAGAPLWGPDLLRVAGLGAGLAAAAGVGMLALRGAWQGLLPPLGLALMMVVLAPPGPWAGLGIVLAAAAIGAAGFGARLPPPLQIAFGSVLAAIALGPALALGRGVDLVPPIALLCSALLAWLWRPRRRAGLVLAGQGVIFLAAAAGLALLA